jgi:hypothetical protein
MHPPIEGRDAFPLRQTAYQKDSTEEGREEERKSKSTKKGKRKKLFSAIVVQ